jgi:hypothetical protein
VNYHAICPRRRSKTFGLHVGEKLGEHECAAGEIHEISSVSFGMATKKEAWLERHVRRRAPKNKRTDYKRKRERERAVEFPKGI